MKRRDDKSGVASFDISRFRVRMLDSCQGAKAEKASTAQTGGTRMSTSTRLIGAKAVGLQGSQ